MDKNMRRHASNGAGKSASTGRIVRIVITIIVVLVLLAAAGWFAYALYKGIEPPVTTTYIKRSPTAAPVPTH